MLAANATRWRARAVTALPSGVPRKPTVIAARATTTCRVTSWRWPRVWTAAVACIGIVATSIALPAADARRIRRATLACDGPSAAHLKHVVAPRNCSILYPNFPLLGGVQLQRLRWSHWGSWRATAIGVSHGFHMRGGGPRPIYARVWRLRRSPCTGGYWYTRLRAWTSEGWHKQFNTAYC